MAQVLAVGDENIQRTSIERIVKDLKGVSGALAVYAAFLQFC